MKEIKDKVKEDKPAEIGLNEPFKTHKSTILHTCMKGFSARTLGKHNTQGEVCVQQGAHWHTHQNTQTVTEMALVLSCDRMKYCSNNHICNISQTAGGETGPELRKTGR